MQNTTLPAMVCLRETPGRSICNSLRTENKVIVAALGYVNASFLCISSGWDAQEGSHVVSQGCKNQKRSPMHARFSLPLPV